MQHCRCRRARSFRTEPVRTRLKSPLEGSGGPSAPELSRRPASRRAGMPARRWRSWSSAARKALLEAPVWLEPPPAHIWAARSAGDNRAEADRMNIHEYQAKELLARRGVPVPAGAIAYTADEAVQAVQRLGGPNGARFWAVKAQIHA